MKTAPTKAMVEFLVKLKTEGRQRATGFNATNAALSRRGLIELQKGLYSDYWELTPKGRKAMDEFHDGDAQRSLGDVD